jgi:glycosyltransferase involved in cell wall biosynthesis
MPSDWPLVTCIMPTGNRPELAPQAVGCFQAQTYPHKELLILDDEFAPSFRRPPVGPGIRYMETRVKQVTGEKRNMACSAADGAIIAHWDDDDLSHPERLTRQVEALLNSEAKVTGYYRMYFLDMRNGSAWYFDGAPRNLIGTSMVYYRDFWATNPFRPVLIGEDFVFAAGAKAGALLSMDSDDMIVARAHGKSTAPKCGEAPWSRVPVESVPAWAREVS